MSTSNTSIDALTSGGLAVFVTSHGFGHLNRTVAVLNRIPSDIAITIYTEPGLFKHWRERLLRPAQLVPRPVDFGAYNPPGDSQTTDGPETIARAIKAHAEACGRINQDTDLLRQSNAQAVLCDAPATPLVAARQASIPAFLLANFTWADIYDEHIGPNDLEARALVDSLRDMYRQATAIFRTDPGLPLTGMAPLINVGLVVTPGNDRREELLTHLGLAEEHRLVYFYVGRYGQADLGWDNLRALGKRGIHFIGFHPPPESAGKVDNLHVAPPDLWTGADLAATCDVAVAKAGYGTVCEVMAAGVPFVYPPRTGFAEHQALETALAAFGGGVRVSPEDFNAFHLETALEAAFALQPGLCPYSIDGAALVANHLSEIIRERSPS
jgi:UDP:flavonoid glycosyltransferase YjiC (YdhE family)